MQLDTEATEDPVIRQDDPLLAERPHLDFQVLRLEGLRHLGDLSGKIWTDHNAHDPGITILETLCYALIDLGYRATQPVEDLLATAPGSSSPASQFPADDNFFTALQILSCNPTTIGDYRKLLLEVEGVRNAWLVPTSKQEVPLSLAVTDVASPQTPAKLLCNETANDQIRLNGLYSVLIEKEPEANDGTVIEEVRKILSAHRNLCEDFKDIAILCPFEVGVCADVEIETTANATVIYGAIIEAVKSYVAPEIRYYTLKQLLDKGRAIEEVFAGRPFKTESFGFVDTEELDSLPLRKDLYASDLYRAILEVNGVVSIRDLSFQTEATAANGGGNIQRLRIPDGYAATFSLERTCIQIRGGRSILHFDKERIHRGLLMAGKPMFHRENLDIPIPQGRFDPELSDYQSIQHDFPVVYGIGKVGLPAEAPLLRKVQARQLQGYLLFYDKLLADYLTQMANIRSLFSLRQESGRSSSERLTYFSQSLEGVPDIGQLLQTSAARDLTDGCVIAVPVANDAVSTGGTFAQKLQELAANHREELAVEDSCGAPPGAFPHFADATAKLREVRIQQSSRDLRQGDYLIEIHEDGGGHFFILRFTQVSALLLVSYSRYRDATEAREAANLAAYLATRPEYYRKSSQQNSQGAIDYRYDLVSDAAANARYLEYLLENEHLYLERREAFLDHLLARFANQFTDYALVRFSAAHGKEEKQEQAVEDKSRFLSQYDDLSRNRGRAFNYLEPSWLTPNVSGYEKRVSLLAGISEWLRRRLCKFEVVPSYRIQMDDPGGGRWFSSKGDYRSEQELEQVVRQLKDPANYPELEDQFTGFNADAVRRIFAETPADENIEVSQHVYGLQLKDSTGKVRQQSEKQDYTKETLAWAGLPRILDEVKEAGESGLELVETGKNSRMYLDKRQLECRIDTLVGYKWHLYDEKGKAVTVAEKTFPNVAAAIADFAQSGDWSRFITQEDGFGWRLTDAQGAVLLTSSARYDDSAAAVKALLEAMEAAQSNKNYLLVGTDDKPEYRIELGLAGGPVLGTTPPLSFADPKERSSSLKTLRKAMKRLHPPLKVERESAQFRWHLYRALGEESEAESTQVFRSKKEATEDFAKFIRRIAEEEPQSHVAQQVYAVESVQIPRRYCFVYCLNSPEGKALPLLRSEKEFPSSDAAKEGYAGFVRALPQLQRTDAAIADGDQVAAVLIDDTEDNRKKADQLLGFMHRQYAEAGEENASQPKWRYLLLDKDHPIAKTKDCYDTKEGVQNDLKNACGFVPLRLDCEHHVIRVICPTLDPKKFHYAICLPDDDGKDFAFLISYLGYESREAAWQAGESHWLQIIELATDSGHYGEGKPLAPEETYDTSSGACAEGEPYLAVMANEFREQLGSGAVEKAVKLAKRYPIRTTYKAESGGKPTKEIKGYHFQGYDLALDKCIWQSIKVYPNPQGALEAYRVFVVALHNCDSCRIVCEEGKYRIHLVEILAESGEFDTGDDAWGDPQRIAKDACDRSVCCHQGVRLFADTAIAEAAFIPKNQEGCYQFIVVGNDYRVARHTCAYDTTPERDEALEKVHDWASGVTCRSYQQTLGDFLRYDIGEGYFLQSMLASSGWKQSEISQIVDRWFYLALGKANYREEGGEWHLIDPSEGDVAIAKIEKDGENFDFEAFQQLVREYPVFKKGDRYCFRLFCPENGGVLDEALEICGCKGPEERAQEAQSFCGKPYLFESVQCYPCRAGAEEAFKVFCDLVKDRRNYDEEEECGVGPYSFTIIDPKRVLATHPNCHPDLDGAMRAAERARACLNDEGMHLIEHILLRPQVHNQDVACECLLPVCPDLDCRLIWQDDLDEDDPCAATKNPPLECIPGSDPYSFWATLVMPGWYQRFRSKETRQYFKEMLYSEVPAMVGLNLLWLSPKQMCEFDEAFRTWLEWRRGPGLLCEDEDNALCDLVNCITRLRDDAPCPTAEAASSECDCLSKVDDQPYDCIEQADQLFWLDCDHGQETIDRSNEESAQPGTPGATTALRAQPPTAKPESIGFDPTEVHQTIAQRGHTYRENIQAIIDKRIRAKNGYKQAALFVENPPSLNAFKQLTLQLLDKDMGRRTTKSYKLLTSVLQNATWYLLDSLVQTHPDEVPENVRSSLLKLLAAMRARGVNTRRMAMDWQIQSLESVMHASAIQQYLGMLEET